MPGNPKPRVDVTAVPSVGFCDRPGQTILAAGHEDQMYMIRHEAIGPNFDTVGFTVLGKQVTIERVVVLLNKDLLAAITPLRDMVGNTGNRNSGKPGHDRIIAKLINNVNG